MCETTNGRRVTWQETEIESNMGAGKSKTVAETMNFDISVLDALAEDARKVIENHFESQEATISELKENYERFKVDTGNVPKWQR